MTMAMITILIVATSEERFSFFLSQYLFAFTDFSSLEKVTLFI